MRSLNFAPTVSIDPTLDLISLSLWTPHNGASANGNDGGGPPTTDDELWHLGISLEGQPVFGRRVNDAHTNGGLNQKILFSNRMVAFEIHDPTYYPGKQNIGEATRI